MEILIAYLLLERAAMLETIAKARLAAQDNLQRWNYKNEEALYDLFLECERWRTDEST